MANNFQIFQEGTKILTTTVKGVERFLLTDLDTADIGTLECEEFELASDCWIGWDTTNSIDLGVTANEETVDSQAFEFAVITDPSDGKMRVVETGFINLIPRKRH